MSWPVAVCVLSVLIGQCLLSGCGTARAIAGDYADDAVVESIRPTSGVSGEEVTFEAKCCLNSPGAPEPDYEWNFGDAAFPSTSFEKNPVVTLRAGSTTPFNATLKLSKGCLGENMTVTTPFQINIAPLEVIAVTGTTGIAGGSGVFVPVIGTGVVDEYTWDFGGAGTPSGAVGQNPQITLTGTPGTYPGRLIVSNQFEATEFLFDIVVL